MKIRFNIDYTTFWGQRLMIVGSASELGSWKDEAAYELTFVGGSTWEADVEFAKGTRSITYNYLVFNENTGVYEREFGVARELKWTATEKRQIYVKDNWRDIQHPQNTFYTSPFKNALISDDFAAKNSFAKSKTFQFRLRTKKVAANQKVGIVGDSLGLGQWKEEGVQLLQRGSTDTWYINLALPADDFPAAYKYVLCDAKTGKVQEWETSGDRSLTPNLKAQQESITVISDEYAEIAGAKWKSSGVAIPVFSLRSRQGMGVGEFADLKLMVDWAVKAGMKMIQILPVNDTVATNTWTDSYPYAAISVFALHPIYLNLEAMGKLKSAARVRYYEAKKEELNALSEVDYEAVMEAKWSYTKELYEQEGAKLLVSKPFQQFLLANESWLPAYAMFAHLRDQNNTSDFSRWDAYHTVDQKEIAAFTRNDSPHYKAIAYYYFLQYHLDKQLKEATTYAREHGVVLKGDIPIGIYRNSVDAWVNPHLYNMDCQAGAPPDDFSATGQNWGFPTYNWEEMALDGYAWWKNRLQKMADYFDVFRIDHILGFFRIWEIPNDAVDGILGRFNPSLPYTVEDLRQQGIHFDYDRMCKPFIREYMFGQVFGDLAGHVRETFFDHQSGEVYQFKQAFDTQRKVKDYFDQLVCREPDQKEHHDFIRHKLYAMLAEVIFLEAPLSNGQAFNPRIAFHDTYSFSSLDDHTKGQLDKLYVDYFYHRHNSFWAEKALSKLPALKEATDMLICGEDLGMVPDCVPGVMDQLKILSLAIQRMPNDSSKEFWHPSDTPYFSVCSTSSHDMSTIRGWWEEDRDAIQRFYEHILGHHQHQAPYFCEPQVATEIITQHLFSPSMWAIFPIQDLLATEGPLRRENPGDERINVPANPQHYWRYRLHLATEDLIEQENFNNFLKDLITSAGRNVVY